MIPNLDITAFDITYTENSEFSKIFFVTSNGLVGSIDLNVSNY